MSREVPRSFRRDSRLFLWIAVLLVLFLNTITLLFFRNAVAWGTLITERRAGEILRRVSLSRPPEGPAETMERAAIEPDVLLLASYDGRGRRLQSFGHGLDAPAFLATLRPAAGRTVYEWRKTPPLLLATLAAPDRYYAVALDPGPGATLRDLAALMAVLVPVAGVLLVILAWLYLRSLLKPYDQLLETARSVPEEAGPHRDERDFVIGRFESTIAALSEKERQLAHLARIEKERADDLETAARTLARNLPTGLLSIDPDGLVVELNEAGREILLLPADGWNKPFADVLAEAPEFTAVLSRVLAEKEAIGRREVRWSRGGEERILGLTATAAMGADGRFLGVLALFTDLSEVRRLEARVALARHFADLGEISAGAAHEFRNAAAAIDGYADLALRTPARAQDHLKAIRREAQEMSRVTSDFLLFARPEGFVPERVALESVAEVASAEIEVAFPDATIARTGDFPEVSGSPVLLRRALANLLRNAVEATPPSRRREPDAVVLNGARRGNEIELTVEDRGAGVDPAHAEKIFMPFFSTKRDGVGFGLAIVVRIADLHGGTVEVAARPGGGSRFILRLTPERAPRRAPLPDPPAGEPAAPQSST